MTLQERQTQVEEYYQDLSELPSTYLHAYAIYSDQFNFRDCKIYSGMGDLIGLNVSAVREILEKDYGFRPSEVSDILRKIRLIDIILTDVSNERKAAQQQVDAASKGSKGGKGSIFIPGNA